MTTEMFLMGLQQGFILAFVAYGIMLPFRMLDFPDLTAEGAYPMGGAICTMCLLIGFSATCSLLLGALAAGFMGMGTAWVHLRLKVNTLLAGILLSTMAYSFNLKLMGKPNLALFQQVTLFNGSVSVSTNFLLIVILVITVMPLYLFLKTEHGLKLRAVGLNPEFARRQGISVIKNTYLGLFLAGCFTGLSGGLMVQFQNYMDIGMGVGIVIHGLAALMLGEAILGQSSLPRQLLAPLVGALVYQQIQGLALSCGLAPSDLKLFTGAMVLLILGLQATQHIALNKRLT